MMRWRAGDSVANDGASLMLCRARVMGSLWASAIMAATILG